MVHIDGYRELASFIASDKDRSAAVFRRFDELAIRNLLYIQSELLELEARLERLDQKELKANLAVKAGLRDWSEVRKAAEDPSNTSSRDRLEVVDELRRTMKEYRKLRVCCASVSLTLGRRAARS